jgi:hypothetical protein
VLSLFGLGLLSPIITGLIAFIVGLAYNLGNVNARIEQNPNFHN